MKLAFLTLFFTLLSVSAHATPPSGLTAQPLMRITTNESKAFSVFSALINQSGELEGFYAKDNEGKHETFWLKDVEKSNGVTLIERKGYEVIKIRGQLNRTTQEGRLTADYLVNGLWGTREPCEFDLKKNASGWFVRSIYTKKQVTKVHVIASSVGVKQLQGLCPAGK